MPKLTQLFLAPLLASFLIFTLSRCFYGSTKIIAFIFSLIPLIFLLSNYNQWIGSEVDVPWLSFLSVHFHLKVDSLSLIFLLLTVILTPIAILTGRYEYSPFFYGLVLLLEGLLIGFFTARDLVLFTFFWEAMLIPLYFIISSWGGSYRRYAALKFFVYMIAGSALMIAAVLFLYFASLSTGQGTFNMDALASTASTLPYAAWIAAIFSLAFAVKTPLFPFHAWLPDAYCEAPTSGTILLSGLLSKAGIYGFLRIGLELFPQYMLQWSPLLLGLAIAGVFYAGLAAWRQEDYKRLIAYSSLSHVNFILAGIFILNQTARSGAILQAFNHGITIAGLFLVVGWLEERLGNTTLGKVKGMAQFLPHLCWVTLAFVLASVALPATNNFVGEILILFGMFIKDHQAASILALSVILSVIYMLRFMQKIYFDSPSLFQEQWVDLKAKEFAIAIPLLILIFWVGIYPSPFLNLTEPDANQTNLLSQREESI